MRPEAPTATAPRRAELRALFERRSGAVSLAIVLAVLAQVVAVTVHVAPPASSLPMSTDFRMWDSRTLESVRLSDYRGRVVLLDFMATWCETCRASMPDLLAIQERFAGPSFTVLSVTTYPRDGPATMEAYRTEFSANWTFGIPVDAVQVGVDYGVTGYPTLVLLDRDGRMTYRAIGLVPLGTLVSHIEDTLRP